MAECPSRLCWPSSGLSLDALLSQVFLTSFNVRLDLLMHCLLGFPDLNGLLHVCGLGPRSAATPEAPEAEHSEKPQLP